MEHESPRPLPAHLAPLAPATPDSAHWTPTKQRIFLAALLEIGSVAHAARAAGMSRSSAHRLRRRLVGTPFDRTWAHALVLYAARSADPFGADAAPSPARERGAPVATEARR